MEISTFNWTMWALIPASFFVVYLYLRRNYNYWKKQGVKEELTFFPFGNVLPCLTGKKNPIKLISEFYKKGEGEKMFGFYSFDKPHLILRDPELIKDVFIRDFNNFSDKVPEENDNDTLGDQSPLLVHNPRWKQIRQKLTPLYTSAKLKNMFELMLESCQDFYDHLDGLKIDDKIGKPVDMKELVEKLMTDIIGTTAFGLKLNTLKDPDAAFHKYGQEINKTGWKRYYKLLSIFFIPALRPFISAKFFTNQGTDFFRKLFSNAIDERIKTGIKKPDLINLFIDLTREQDNKLSDGFKLECDALVAQASILFLTGLKATSSTTSFALYELAKNSEVQTRLRNEILDGIENNGGEVTYEMVSSLPYLNMVVHEVLRMHPNLAWVDRIALNDYIFSGTNVTLKKGFPVILPMGAIQRDPKYFPDPEKFDPERFSEENETKITPFTYFPFGEGPRNCIGSKLGLIQIKLAVLSLLKNYEVAFCDETLNPLKLDELHVLNKVKNLSLNLKKISA